MNFAAKKSLCRVLERREETDLWQLHSELTSELEKAVGIASPGQNTLTSVEAKAGTFNCVATYIGRINNIRALLPVALNVQRCGPRKLRSDARLFG